MSVPTTIDRSLLELPDDATVGKGVAAFASAIQRHYGDRLRHLYLFGSRARGDHSPDSDADVAVVLGDEGWDFWREKMALADLAYEVLIAWGVDVQGWPVRESEWNDPAQHHNPALIQAMQRDGVVQEGWP